MLVDLTQVPSEVVFAILNALPPGVAVKMAQTSRAFRRFVLADPNGYPWERVEVPLCPHVSNSLLARLGPRVRRVRFLGSIGNRYSVPFDNALLYNCAQGYNAVPVLTELSVFSARLPAFPHVHTLRLPQLLLWVEPPAAVVGTMIGKFPGVVDVAFGGYSQYLAGVYGCIVMAWPELQKIRLTRLYGPWAQVGLSDFLNQATQLSMPLQVVEVDNMTDLDDRLWPVIAAGCANSLHTLHIRHEGGYGIISDLSPLERLVNLRSLRLSFTRGLRVSGLTDASLAGLARLSPQLKELHIPAGKFSSHALIAFFETAAFVTNSNLKVFHFSEFGCQVEVNDDVLRAIGTHCQGLESFYFHFGCNGRAVQPERVISDVGFAHLLALPRLWQLWVENRICKHSPRGAHPRVRGPFLDGFVPGPHRSRPLDIALEGPHFQHIEPDKLRAFCTQEGFKGQLVTDNFNFDTRLAH